jgi:hypothetical protein
MTEPTKCKPGFYNDELGQSSCKPCEKGYACFDEGMQTYLLPNLDVPKSDYERVPSWNRTRYQCTPGNVILN